MKRGYAALKSVIMQQLNGLARLLCGGTPLLIKEMPVSIRVPLYIGRIRENLVNPASRFY